MSRAGHRLATAPLSSARKPASRPRRTRPKSCSTSPTKPPRSGRRRKIELGEIGLPPPFWAFAWAGGQALARYLLDHPETVAGKKVLDFASGSGLVAIAAAKAGAARVEACDIDPFALASMRLNAAANQVTIFPRENLAIGADEGWDVVLAGDVSYEQDMARAITDWLQTLHRRGARVLIGDPGRTYLARDRLEEIADYRVPVTRALEDCEIKRAGVWRFKLVPGRIKARCRQQIRTPAQKVEIGKTAKTASLAELCSCFVSRETGGGHRHANRQNTDLKSNRAKPPPRLRKGATPFSPPARHHNPKVADVKMLAFFCKNRTFFAKILLFCRVLRVNISTRNRNSAKTPTRPLAKAPKPAQRTAVRREAATEPSNPPATSRSRPLP